MKMIIRGRGISRPETLREPFNPVVRTGLNGNIEHEKYSAPISREALVL